MNVVKFDFRNPKESEKARKETKIKVEYNYEWKGCGTKFCGCIIRNSPHGNNIAFIIKNKKGEEEIRLEFTIQEAVIVAQLLLTASTVDWEFRGGKK